MSKCSYSEVNKMFTTMLSLYQYLQFQLPNQPWSDVLNEKYKKFTSVEECLIMSSMMK